MEISDLCNKYGIFFKINTVVTKKNKNENMSGFINILNFMRWKVFQVLNIEGENDDEKTGKNWMKEFLITSEEFNNYINMNKEGLDKKEILLPEDNNQMRSSYILIDELGRFLDTSNGMKIPTKSILDVGVESAFDELLKSEGKGFDMNMFDLRGGYYHDKWNKDNKNNKPK